VTAETAGEQLRFAQDATLEALVRLNAADRVTDETKAEVLDRIKRARRYLAEGERQTRALWRQDRERR
jgi:hypothetical protein